MNGRGKRWTVRYRDPSGKQRSEAFDRKADADRRLAEVSSAVHRGTYVDPVLGRTTTGAWLDEWLRMNDGRWKPTTVAKRRQLIRDWFRPAFGDVPLSALRPSAVQSAVSAWQARHAAGTVAHAVSILRMALDAAVLDGRIPSNPATRVQRKPSKRRRDVQLSDAEVARIMAAVPDTDRAFLLHLALAGCRLGEALALEVSDLDLLRGTARIWRQVDTSKAERAYIPLKGADRIGEHERTVPVVDALRDALAAHLAARRASDGCQPVGPVFVRSGRPLTRGMVDAMAERTARASGVAFSPHALRHYFGSALISRGVPVTQVAAWMGHESPRTTLQVYSYCMPQDDETGRVALRAAASALLADVHPMCTATESEEGGVTMSP